MTVQNTAKTVAAAQALTTATPKGKVNVHTLPQALLLVDHGQTPKGNAKVIISSALEEEGVGTIQLYAPFGQDEALLAEFPAGAVLDNTQGEYNHYYFRHSNGSNYTLMAPDTAQALMNASKQNSSVMPFGIANEQLSREQLRVVKAINNGDIGKVAVSTNGGVLGWLGGILK